MKHEDLYLLEDAVRTANPIPHSGDLVGSEGAARVLLLVRTQTQAELAPPRSAAEPVRHVEPAAVGPVRETRTRRWRPAVTFVAAFFVLLATIGILAVTRNDQRDVVEEREPTTTTTATGTTTTALESLDETEVFTVVQLPQTEASPDFSRPFNDVLDLAFGPDGSLWAATAGGIVHWDLEAGTPTVFTEADGLQGPWVDRIDVADDGTVWVSAQEWVARYDGTWTSYQEFGDIDVGPVAAVAATSEGTAWFWADMSPKAGLLRYDGMNWTAVPAPDDWLVVDELWGGWAVSLDVAPDGRLWVGSNNGVLAFDGESWSHHTPADGTLPSLMAPWVSAGPDGTIWVGTGSLEGDEVRDEIAAAGVVAFDGSSWITHTIDDGLATNEARVVVGSDGTVWALHDNEVSRLDVDHWTNYAATGPDFGSAAVGADGTLWGSSASGIEQFDGSVTAELVVLPEAAPRGISALALTPVGAPTTTATPIGDITWYRFTEPAGHTLWDIEITPSGLVAIDGGVLRWSEDLATWSGGALPIDPWRLSTDGNRVVSHREAAVWLDWDGEEWIATELLEIDGIAAIEQIEFGSQGAIITSHSRMFYSTDEHDFILVEDGPDPNQLQEDWTDQESLVGCYSSSSSWPGEGSIGPVLTTDSGFVAMTPAHPANWNNEPLCEPILWYSRSGESWDLLAVDTPFGKGAIVQDVASYAGRHVAVGRDERGPAAVWISDDTTTWTSLDLPGGLTSPTAVAGGELGWVLLEDQGAGWVSEDGVTWFPIPEGMPATRTFWVPQNISMGHGMIAISGTEELVFGVLNE